MRSSRRDYSLSSATLRLIVLPVVLSCLSLHSPDSPSSPLASDAEPTIDLSKVNDEDSGLACPPQTGHLDLDPKTAELVCEPRPDHGHATSRNH